MTKLKQKFNVNSQNFERNTKEQFGKGYLLLPQTLATVNLTSLSPFLSQVELEDQIAILESELEVGNTSFPLLQPLHLSCSCHDIFFFL
jgi:hypothetical protein